MRKLLLIAATLSAVLCAGDSAHAFDVKNKFIISALGGLAIPAGDFSSADSANVEAGGAKLGYNLGLAIEYGLSDVIQIGARLAVDRFAIDRELIWQTRPDTIRADSFLVAGDWSVVEYLGVYAKALMLPGKNTWPFARAGVFLAKPKLSLEPDENTWSGEYDVSLGIEAALGVTHIVSPQFGIGLEARFAHLNTSESDDAIEAATGSRSTSAYGPAGVRDPGGNIDWLAVNAVVSYGF